MSQGNVAFELQDYWSLHPDAWLWYQAQVAQCGNQVVLLGSLGPSLYKFVVLPRNWEFGTKTVVCLTAIYPTLCGNLSAR